MFIDHAKVLLKAGRGGNGAVSFRHEKYVDKGGPDGGDGGRGGDIIFQADNRKDTLVDFRYQPNLKADNGENGGKRQKRGKSGQPLMVMVPVGTIIYRDDQLVADLDTSGKQIVVARGGDGGYGNAHFKSSTRQAPRVAELGELGDEYEARLELKLLADVGLVGFPNAGKSTFLSVVTAARPEIADYAFTTLTPHLGVAQINDEELLIADIPGLIEGASEGKGLGDAFLRHVERTAVLLHLIDAYQEDVASAYQTIRRELAAYSEALTTRPEVVVLTKIEGLDEEIITMQREALATVVDPDTPVCAMSSNAHIGTDHVLQLLLARAKDARAAQLEHHNDEDEASSGIPTISLSGEAKADAWRITRQDDRYVIRGHRIEKFAMRTDPSNVHSLNRLRDIMKKMGIMHHLLREGATGESLIVIGERVFTLDEQDRGPDH